MSKKTKTSYYRIVKDLRKLAKDLEHEEEDETIIPQNECGIKMGTYSIEEIAEMIYFLADMLE